MIQLHYGKYDCQAFDLSGLIESILMPRMKIVLTPAQEAFVRQAIAAGR